MDFGALFGVLRRHWVVFGLALLITIAATYAMAVKGPSKYQSQVQLAMLNGSKINAQAGIYGNPYLGFNQTLSIDVDLLTRNLSSPASLQELQALGVTGTVTAEFAPNATGPFMELIVTGHNRAAAAHSMGILVTFAEQRWLQLQQQAKAPNNSIVTLRVISPPGPPALSRKTKYEYVGGVAIVGLILSLLLPTFVEALRRRRPEAVPRAGADEYAATQQFAAFSNAGWQARPDADSAEEQYHAPVEAGSGRGDGAASDATTTASDRVAPPARVQ